MDNLSYEQLATFGALGLVVLSVAMLVIFMLMAFTLKLCISWLGNRNPSFAACIGWLLAITFVNSFLVFGSMVTFGQQSLLLVTPLTWFVTLYLIAQAADCGLFRAFGIWIANSVMSSIGLVAVMFVAAIPLAMVGQGLRDSSEETNDPFEPTANDLAAESVMSAKEKPPGIEPVLTIPDSTEVSFQPGDGLQPSNETPVKRPGPIDVSAEAAQPLEAAKDETLGSEDPGNQSDSGAKTLIDRETESEPVGGLEVPELNAPRNASDAGGGKPVKADSQGQPRAVAAPRKTSPLLPRRPKKAPDGSTLNPFFQN